MSNCLKSTEKFWISLSPGWSSCWIWWRPDGKTSSRGTTCGCWNTSWHNTRLRHRGHTHFKNYIRAGPFLSFPEKFKYSALNFSKSNRFGENALPHLIVGELTSRDFSNIYYFLKKNPMNDQLSESCFYKKLISNFYPLSPTSCKKNLDHP